MWNISLYFVCGATMETGWSMRRVLEPHRLLLWSKVGFPRLLFIYNEGGTDFGICLVIDRYGKEILKLISRYTEKRHPEMTSNVISYDSYSVYLLLHSVVKTYHAD